MTQNALTIPDAPAYLQALLASHPALASMNQEALSGASKPMPPAIVADKGRFIIKNNGEETVITFPALMGDGQPHPAAGQPVAVLQAVVLRGKPGKEKAWYATKYTPGQETQAPDCSSDDGVKPNADSRLKQCESCAACAQNVFGSGTNQDGTPSGGKACADRKVVALFANGAPYRFAIPPASLKSWDSYCNQLSVKGIPLAAVITIVGFEQGDTAYKLTFTFGGMLAEAQLAKLLPLLETPEVLDIVSPRSAVLALPAPVEQKQVEAPADLDAARIAKEKAEADKKEKADKAKTAKEKKEAEEKAKAAAAAAAQQGAGLDLGLGVATPSATTSPSDDDLINSLGL